MGNILHWVSSHIKQYIFSDTYVQFHEYFRVKPVCLHFCRKWIRSYIGRYSHMKIQTCKCLSLICMLIQRGKQKTPVISLTKCNWALGTERGELAESDLCSALELAHFPQEKSAWFGVAHSLIQPVWIMGCVIIKLLIREGICFPRIFCLLVWHEQRKRRQKNCGCAVFKGRKCLVTSVKGNFFKSCLFQKELHVSASICLYSILHRNKAFVRNS